MSTTKKRLILIHLYIIVSSTHTNLLDELYKTGANHSTINFAKKRCFGLSECYWCYHMGSHPIVCNLFKGAFEQRPSLPKYTETWDTDRVIDSFAEWPDTNLLSMK